jgi:hypothetical protein
MVSKYLKSRKEEKSAEIDVERILHNPRRAALGSFACCGNEKNAGSGVFN